MDAFLIAIDLSLLVLSSLVQWIIYPSMSTILPEQFASWHKTYVRNITWIVLPLMTIQLILSGYHFYYYPDLLFLLRMVIILLIWMITLGFAAPIHNSLGITSAEDRPSGIRKLIIWNGWRTALWFLLSVLSICLVVL